MSSDPTGRRFRIRSGDTVAEIAQVGAALRAFAVDGVDYVPRYADDSPTPAASGVVLVPWPNRIRDGRWSLDGTDYRLALTEPALSNASHGLLRFMPYQPEHEAPDAVTLAATVFPQTGYPFRLDTTVTFTVADGTLHVAHTIANASRTAAPVALGMHPYLCIGGVATADLVLTASGRTRLLVDDQKIPVGHEPVDADTDLRAGRRLGEVDLDTAYTDLERGADGAVRARLAADDGRAVTLWQGPGFAFQQVFTTDRYPGQPLAVAVEPMTAPSNAFASGDHLRLLEPGGTWALEWGLTVTP